MPNLVHLHRMKIITGKKYFCGESGCSGHVPATLICSCGHKNDFDDPDPHRNSEMVNEHMKEVVKAAGFIFDLVK